MAIKNIVLDLGGVLIDIDYDAPVREFFKLGISNFEDFYSQKAATPFFEGLETGKISNDEFVEYGKSLTLPDTTTAQIITAWNSILGLFRPNTIAYINQLKHQYNLYLLSNTNAIHCAAFEEMFFIQFGYDLKDLFHITYYSQQIHYRKPYKETYEYVLQDAKINANETIFVDDSPVNIPAPKSLGITTHLLLPNETLETVLPKYLLGM
jgi:glucose-1-phosphatase